MNDFLMFLAPLVFGGIFLFFAEPICKTMISGTLRVGLVMIGVGKVERDRIVRHELTGQID